MAWGNSFDMLKPNDNLIFVCDTCEAIFDPGISGFQALIDAARAQQWKVKFHVLKAGYSTWCPKCADNSC